MGLAGAVRQLHVAPHSLHGFSDLYCVVTVLCWVRSEVKERMKKAKADKASVKAADAKKAGGKATKNASRGGKVAIGKR